jgi:hypothetical protein
VRERIITVIIFIIILASSLYFGLPRLYEFSGVDEPYWSYGRVPKFWQSIRDRNWKATHFCDKPGIGTVIVSGAGLPFIDGNPKDLQKFRYNPKTQETLLAIRDLYYKLRIPMFVFTLLSLPILYLLIRKLLGRNTARLSIIFIGLSPILLGISLIINTDAVLWILTAMATLNLFVFFKTQEKKHLYLSGALLGFSVISKFPANVLFVYFFLLFLLEYVFANKENLDISEYLKKSLLNYFQLFAIAMATGFVFFPAAWIKIKILLKYTLIHPVFSATLPVFIGVIGFLAFDYFFLKSQVSKIIFGFSLKHRNIITKLAAGIFLAVAAIVVLIVYFGVNIYDIQSIIASPKGSPEGGISFSYFISMLTADLYSFMFSVSPVVLVSFLVALIYLYRGKNYGRDLITALYIIIFILAFYAGSTVNHTVTTVRYQIMTYPLAFILAAIGLNGLLENEKIKGFIALPAVYGFLLISLTASLFLIKPNFLAYASEILPGNMIVNLKGMGEGSFEAGEYLNSLPGASNMTIWSDKGAVCEAFVGKCYIDYGYKKIKDINFDYFVVSTDRRSRSSKMGNGLNTKLDINFDKIYDMQNFEFQAIIGGRPNNFVKVFKTDKISNTL